MKNPGQHQILIVDDDAGSRNALARILRDEGYRVLTLDSAAAAMEALRRGPLPELIVLDLMMPGMDGWDFRHAQKHDADLAHIPVIAVSAAGKLPDADEYFRKPLDLERFLTAVKRYLQPPPSPAAA
jgi:CheY-like chemotaxis protein